MSEKDLRLPALYRFATAISILTILGHCVLGFEPSWAAVAVALIASYGTELLLELLQSAAEGRAPRFRGGLKAYLNFFVSSHITGLAISMLLYTNEQLWPIAFACAVAIGSKAIFRIPTEKGTRHFLNPSNLGIAVTLALFPYISISPPYQFTENLAGIGDWIVPGLIVCSGSYLNARLTRKIPLIAGWGAGFVIQALLRSAIFGTSWIAALVPMTGMAFLLFSFYMVSDPATTPTRPWAQVAFGMAVAAVYGVLQVCHVVFGLFFALVITCTLRGLVVYALGLRRTVAQTSLAPAVVKEAMG